MVRELSIPKRPEALEGDSRSHGKADHEVLVGVALIYARENGILGGSRANSSLCSFPSLLF